MSLFCRLAMPFERQSMIFLLSIFSEVVLLAQLVLFFGDAEMCTDLGKEHVGCDESAHCGKDDDDARDEQNALSAVLFGFRLILGWIAVQVVRSVFCHEKVPRV